MSLPSAPISLAEVKSYGLVGIPTSNQLTGLELRLARVLILDNKQAYIPWIVRYSDLYLLLSTVDNLGGNPQTISIKGFANVDDNEELPVERTAYYWEPTSESLKPPSQIHLVASIIKSNKGIRDTGAALQKLQQDQSYMTVIQNVVKAVATGGASILPDTLIALTGLLGGILGSVDDTPLITQVMSFTGINGDFDKLGRHTFLRKNRYAQVETTLVVRDSNREPQDSK
jgi:hypothetical protein